MLTLSIQDKRLVMSSVMRDLRMRRIDRNAAANLLDKIGAEMLAGRVRGYHV